MNKARAEWPKGWVASCEASSDEWSVRVNTHDWRAFILIAELGQDSESEAHLIAAAPAMVEALERIVEADKRLHDTLAGIPGDADDHADFVAAQAEHELAIRQCRAALSLARGETK